MFVNNQVKLSSYFYMIFLIISLPGCGHKMRFHGGMLRPSALSKLSIGMEKQQVIDLISEPDIVRGSFKDEAGDIVEVLEYNVEGSTSNWMLRYSQQYWLYFKNDKLVRWGKAGDWNEVKSIHEIRLK